MKNVVSMASHYQYGGIFHSHRCATNVTSRNIPSMASHCQYCIAEYLDFSVAQKILPKISSVALHYKWCIVEYFVCRIAQKILQQRLHYRKFRQWRRIINVDSRKISSINVAVSILDREIICLKRRTKDCIAENFVSGVALKILHHEMFRLCYLTNDIPWRDIHSFFFL